MRARRAVLATVAALIVILLSGCLNYSADVTVSKEDRVSGTVILTRETKPVGGVEVLPTPAPLPSGAPGSATSNKIEFPKPVSDTDSIVVSPYSDGTKVGYKIEYKRATFKEAAAFTPLGDRGGALVFTRDGDTVTFAASFDLTFDAGTEAQKALLAKNVTATVKLNLPGTIGDTNGTVADNAITWTVEPLKANDLTATYASAAPAPSATDKSASTASKHKDANSTNWIIIGAVVLGLLIIGAVLFGLLRWRRTRKNAAHPAASAFETSSGPIGGTGPTGPIDSGASYGSVQPTYAQPPAEQSVPRYGETPVTDIPSAAAPAIESPVVEPTAVEPTAVEPRDGLAKWPLPEDDPNERTTTYEVAEQKRGLQHEPASASGVPESSAMDTETSPADASAPRGGWPPPQPKWKQEP
nr:hypothetical protein [Antricoccus suffuscus]